MKIFVFFSYVGILTLVLCSCNSSPESHFAQDSFDDGKEQWRAWYDPTYPTAPCESVVNPDFGLPAPSLTLKNIPGQCSGADILNGMIFTDGTVELDVYLETDALIDVVFRGDLEKNTGYIARLDSRDYPDTFVKIDTWKMLGQNSGHTTSPNQWHHMQIEIEGSSFTLFSDGQVVAQAVDPEFVSGEVGLMNEVNYVHVDNVTISSKGKPQTVDSVPSLRPNVNTLTLAGILVFGICVGGAILLLGITIGYSIRRR